MKKQILTLGTLLVSTISITGAVSCSLFSNSNDQKRSKLEFYNYEDYMNDQDQNPSKGTNIYNINKYYHYSVFGDLHNFKTYIEQDRTVGGIGSDYFSASLAEKNLLRKIDFSRLFNITSDKSKWAEELQKIYTPEAWGMLNAFELHRKNKNDEYLNEKSQIVDKNKSTRDLDGDGTNDYLWEYMVPYFTQNKVVAFNPFSSNFDQENSNVKNILQSKDQINIQKLFEDNLTYEGILRKLKSYSKGNQKLNFVINDYMRDNMMIGSEVLDSRNNNNPKTNGEISSKEEGISQLDAYREMIKKHVNVTASSTSGTDSLTSLLRINNKNSKADVGFIYNGDALFGWKGGEIEGAKPNEFRIVIPKNSTYLSDGLIMVKSTTESNEEQDRFYKAVREGIYNGSTTKYWQKEKVPFEGFKSNLNMIYQNYNFVAYTPAFENLHQMINDTENHGGISEPVGKFIANATREATKTSVSWNRNTINLPSNLNKNHLAQPISKNITSILVEHNRNKIAITDSSD